MNMVLNFLWVCVLTLNNNLDRVINGFTYKVKLQTIKNPFLNKLRSS